MNVTSTLIPAASLILLRAEADGLEILLLKRSPQASNFAGTYVFPGGVLDASDSEAQTVRRLRGLTPQQAGTRLRMSPDAVAAGHWMAAVRECFEETGIVLAVDEQSRAPTEECLQRLQACRTQAGHFFEALEREGLWVPADVMPYFAHWVTPPVQARRFNTRFFLAEMPARQECRVDGLEMVDARWSSPLEMLERERSGELKLGSIPTRRILEELANFVEPAAALAYAATRPQVPENRPRLAQGRQGRRIFQREEAAYAEIAWVDPEESGQSSYELEADQPKRLDSHCVRVIAPNAGMMTGPGTNSYLIGEGSVAIIDPGPDDPQHVRALLDAARGEICWILLTHTHPDHAPAAATLRRLTGAKILGGGAVRGVQRQVDVDFDRELQDGESLRLGGLTLQAIRTPGHASNHVCYLLEATGMLFSGDQLVQGFTVVIAPPDGNMRAYLDSLERLRALGSRIIAPGHGFLIGEPQQEIDRVIRHRLAREQKVRRALQEQGGSSTLASLLPRVYDDVPATLHALAELSLTAHLEKLVEDGELKHAGGNWSVAEPRPV
jgi:glyoxylase-like metal-dependent hydrolase (beta-lactamase superfamily II)/8-oxo-dGTP pyrophosphatase MutT (NUDIX family)